MQIKLIFDPTIKEEVGRAKKITSALSALTENVIEYQVIGEYTEEDTTLDRHDRYGEWYWQWMNRTHNPATQKTMGWIDEMIDILNNINVLRGSGINFAPFYNEHFIEPICDGAQYNDPFLKFYPGTNELKFRPQTPKTAETDQLIKDGGWPIFYNDDHYTIHLIQEEVYFERDILMELIDITYRHYFQFM